VVVVVVAVDCVREWVLTLELPHAVTASAARPAAPQAKARANT
jgi:hypothetical protein